MRDLGNLDQHLLLAGGQRDPRATPVDRGAHIVQRFLDAHPVGTEMDLCWHPRSVPVVGRSLKAAAVAVSLLVAPVAAADGAALTMKRARAAALKDEKAGAKQLVRLGVAGYPGDWEVAGSKVGRCHRRSAVVIDCAARSTFNYFGDLPSEPTSGAKGMRCTDRLRVRLRSGRTHVRPLSSSCHLTS
jgi:hypothetical protein